MRLLLERHASRWRTSTKVIFVRISVLSLKWDFWVLYPTLLESWFLNLAISTDSCLLKSQFTFLKRVISANYYLIEKVMLKHPDRLHCMKCTLARMKWTCFFVENLIQIFQLYLNLNFSVVPSFIYLELQ